MRTVGAREGNQQFSKLLAEVERGREIVITKRGKPVAKIVPLRPPVSPEERKKALKRLMKLLKKGVNLGKDYRFNRDELYDR
jgi:prevent-host-death family protein